MLLLNEALLRMLGGWQRFLARTRDEEGQTLAEYALIMTVIAVAAVALGMIVFRDALATAFNGSVNCLNRNC